MWKKCLWSVVERWITLAGQSQQLSHHGGADLLSSGWLHNSIGKRTALASQRSWVWILLKTFCWDNLSSKCGDHFFNSCLIYQHVLFSHRHSSWIQPSWQTACLWSLGKIWCRCTNQRPWRTNPNPYSWTSNSGFRRQYYLMLLYLSHSIWLCWGNKYHIFIHTGS